MSFRGDFMYVTNLDKKIANTKKKSVIPTLCVWSDLLGFSNPFIDSGWSPSDEQWDQIASRLQEMQNICAKNLNPVIENCLVSNDAIIRNLNIIHCNGLEWISMWFRDILFYWAQVNTNEKRKNLPGLRLVMAAGERLLHNMEQVTMEDYIFNYTKPDPEGPSNMSRQYGDRVIMYNHDFMQMNTAFSKGYIIDSIGSKGGIKGNRFYIDQSVIEFLKEYARQTGIDEAEIIDTSEENLRKVAFVVKKTGWYSLGLEREGPIHVEERNLVTNVYRLRKYYPWDEDPGEFWFDLDDMEMPAILGVVEMGE